MVFNAATVGYSVTPAVVSTLFSHYLNKKPNKDHPTADISYDEGIHLIRQFLVYTSHHTVEDIQRFTAQWVPHPRWVKVDVVGIPAEYMEVSASHIHTQLGIDGIEKVGGKTWWQWRRKGGELKAEWIEMRGDYVERKKLGPAGGNRVMFYVHGGAYFFGSTDMHRYQMQRHARKLKARVFAPEYRLAPQFPFPCGLYDCLAAYLYLLTTQEPNTIVLAGDSAGGGMVISLLVLMRDQGIPLPAGAILISPWVDLTHSFPSVGQDNPMDYIPPHGFLQRPSASWPPPNSDDMRKIKAGESHKIGKKHEQGEHEAVQGFAVSDHPLPGNTTDSAVVGNKADGTLETNASPEFDKDLSITIDGKKVEIKDQIQMYATNSLISHPLVSPVLQPTLGGLPPLLIMVGGGEMLRDEQIYLAHKAAHPQKYIPGDKFLTEQDREQISKWKATDVQLQVWDDLCHVAPTLSFTRPAKYMYRSVAQFGAWALARAQKTGIEILDDDDISVISSSESDEDTAKAKLAEGGDVGKAGDPLPAFKNHMIRQRVSRKGVIRRMEDASTIPGCIMPRDSVGVIKASPVRKWMKAKAEWDTKYASTKRKVQKKRAKEIAAGYQTFQGPNGVEVPPPSALAGRRIRDKHGEAKEEKEEKRTRSYGLSLWSMWGSKHDETAVHKEEAADRPDTFVASAEDGQNARPLHDNVTEEGRNLTTPDRPDMEKRPSRRRVIEDEEQTDTVWSSNVNNDQKSAERTTKVSSSIPSRIDLTKDTSSSEATRFAVPIVLGASSVGAASSESTNHSDTLSSTNQRAFDDPTIDLTQARPKAHGIAFPFTLKRPGSSKDGASNASIATLTSSHDVPPAEDVRTEAAMVSGVQGDEAQEDRNWDDEFSRGREESLDSEASGEHSRIHSKSRSRSPVKGKGVHDKQTAVFEAGEAVAPERPELKSFITAQEF